MRTTSWIAAIAAVILLPGCQTLREGWAKGHAAPETLAAHAAAKAECEAIHSDACYQASVLQQQVWREEGADSGRKVTAVSSALGLTGEGYYPYALNYPYYSLMTSYGRGRYRR